LTLWTRLHEEKAALAPLDNELDIYECPFCEGWGFLVMYKSADKEGFIETVDCTGCYGIGFIRKVSNEVP
jgi:hypothetical protein